MAELVSKCISKIFISPPLCRIVENDSWVHVIDDVVDAADVVKSPLKPRYNKQWIHSADVKHAMTTTAADDEDDDICSFPKRKCKFFWDLSTNLKRFYLHTHNK